MVVPRWLLVLACWMIADLASPALSGALEALADTEAVVHRPAFARPVAAHDRDDRAVARRAQAAWVARAAAFRQHARRPASLASDRSARKAPPPGAADGPTALDDHDLTRPSALSSALR